MIDPETIDLASLPWLPLDERSAFPRQPAIYFAIASSGEVQYIGISKDPKRRWLQHHRYEQLDALGKVRIAYLFVEDIALLKPIEAALIAWFRPPLNVGVTSPKFTKRIDRRAVQQSKVKLRCRLQDFLDAQNMTRSALAERTGLTSAAIRGLCENTAKRYDADTLAVLCGFFGCGMDDLFEVVFKKREEINS